MNRGGNSTSRGSHGGVLGDQFAVQVGYVRAACGKPPFQVGLIRVESTGPGTVLSEREASHRAPTAPTHHQRLVGPAASVATAMPANSSVKTPVHHQFLCRAALSRPIHISG